jgi:hypothetical protein
LTIYAPNDQTHQVQFLRDLSRSFINQYTNERVVLGGDFNCAFNHLDKRGGRSFELKKTVIPEVNTLLNTHDLVDTWRQRNPNHPGFTWSNPSTKIQCRLDYFFFSKNSQRLISDVKIISKIFSDHSALTCSVQRLVQRKRKIWVKHCLFPFPRLLNKFIESGQRNSGILQSLALNCLSNKSKQFDNRRERSCPGNTGEIVMIIFLTYLKNWCSTFDFTRSPTDNKSTGIFN